MTPRALAVLAIVAALGGCAPTVRAPAPPPAAAAPPATAPTSYEALLERAKAQPADVDFRALRMAYAHSEHYRPYGFYLDSLPPMRQAFDAGDWPRVLEIAESSLRANYVRTRPHFIAMQAHEQLGHAAAAAHHAAMLRGLVQSVLDSGDGRSPETAMVVIDIAEEYDAMAYLNVTSRRQALIRRPGKFFDAHEVEEPNGTRSSLYFDVTLLFERANASRPSR